MVDTLNLDNKNISDVSRDPQQRDQETEAVHHHAEQEAMNAAKRSGDRMKRNEAGNDIINK